MLLGFNKLNMSKKYGVRADKLFRMRHNNKLLEAAIKKGQEQRKSDSRYNVNAR